MKTFAFVTLELYPTTVGGVGILLYHTISALLRNGNRVVLYLDLNDEEICRFEQRDRHGYPNPHLLTFYDVRSISRGLDFCRPLYNDSEQFRSVSIAHAILRTQAQHTIDLIEFYDYCGPAFHYLSYNAAQRRPVAIRFHNTTEIIERGTRSAFSKRRIYAFAMERAQLTLADLVLSPGPAFLEAEIRKLYAPELTRQEVVIAPPIHESIGSVAYNAGSRRILFYGRLSTFKGLDTFINAAVIALRDPIFRAWLQVFVIIGPEETVASALTLDEIKNVIPDNMVDKFQFTGRATHKQLMETLRDISFACFANRIESFCYAAHELYTAGIPLVLADRPAFRDHFTEEDVAFFDRSASGLAVEMIKLAADREKRIASAKRALAMPRTDTSHLYLEFANRAGERRSARAAATTTTGLALLTVFILSNGDQAAEEVTLSSLGHEQVNAYVMRLSETGKVFYDGLKWSLARENDILGAVAIAYMFVRAGDVCHIDVLLEAALCITHEEQVGAIAPWCDVNGRIRAAAYAFVPEFGAMMGPGLRTLIRAPQASTVIELLRAGSFTNETSALLAQRAEARGIVEKPVVGISIGGSVYLPPSPNHPGADYDRMTPTYLALSHEMRLSASDGAREPTLMPRVTFPHHDLISVRGTDVFGEGELWVLRLFSQRGSMHEPWSTVERSDDWMLIKEPHSPAGGALKTSNGELFFWADHHYGIEFLFGPFCSGVEIRWRDCIYRLRLKQELVSSSVVWLDDLVRGLFQPPQSTPSPICSIGQPVLGEGAKAWISANVGPATRKLSLTRDPARTVPGPDYPVVLSSTLVDEDHYNTSDLVFALLAAASEMNNPVIEVPFDLEDGSTIADFLLQGGKATVIVDVDERLPGLPPKSVYRALARWTGLVDVHTDRLEFIGSNEDLLFALREAGARVVQRDYRLPLCPAVISSGEDVDIIILHSDGLIDNVAHMVAGIAFLSDHGIKVGMLYLEEGQHHAMQICETLFAARTYVSYKTLERVIAIPRKRQLLACAVYPDSTIPVQAIKALALGIPTLVGPVGCTNRFSAALEKLSVTFWEDSRDIGKALASLAINRKHIMRAYNETLARQQ